MSETKAPGAGSTKSGLASALSIAAVVIFAHLAIDNAIAQEIEHTTPHVDFALALEDQSAGNFDDMLKHLARSAERGFVPAQEMLGIVLLAGETLYGPAVTRDFCGAIKWFRLAHQNGSDIGTVYNELLLRLKLGRDKCGTEN